MGYSIFIIAKEKRLLREMSLFLENNMIGFNQHFHGSADLFFSLRVGPKGNNSISYKGGINNPHMIGFDFNCGGGERLHMFSILRWMAETISKTPGNYYYDGERSKFSGKSIREDFNHEAENVYEHRDKSRSETLEDLKRMIACHNLGINTIKYKKTGKPYPNDHEMDGNKTTEEIVNEVNEKIEFIENDIKRLDQLWKELIVCDACGRSKIIFDRSPCECGKGEMWIDQESFKR